MTASKVHKGGCLCGAIAFEVDGALRPVTPCHCKQCRVWSGHVWASANAALNDLAITQGADALAWYNASDFARRGFCRICGSSLFWHAEGLDDKKHRIAVAAGALDEPTGLTLEAHIFCAYKGDYYEIPEGETQFDEY